MFDRSPADIVQEMSLELAKRPSLVFLLVEGHDDEKFWKPRSVRGESVCIVARGKANVIESLAHPRRTQAALGIVDADYDHLDGVACPPAICRTDGHDLECLLIRSEALRKVLHESGSTEKIAAFESTSGPVLDRLILMGAELAAFRRANHNHAWGLKFKKHQGRDRVKYSKFVDRGSWTLDRRELVTTVLNYNSRHEPSAEAIFAEIGAMVPPKDPWHWLNGHDLAGILAVGLSHVLGSSKDDLSRVEGSLRLAHETLELESTALCRSIRSWEISATRRVLAF